VPEDHEGRVVIKRKEESDGVASRAAGVLSIAMIRAEADDVETFHLRIRAGAP
jgi:hypothetical protein